MQSKWQFVGLLILGLAATAAADNELSVAVTPRAAFGPVDLTVRTHIAADPQNRSVEVVAESPSFYRSSEVPLDGDRAPRTSTFQFRKVPAGMYEVRVTLFDASGRARAIVRRTVQVIDPTAQ